MTREQIIKMTAETGRLVGENKVGIAPLNPRYVTRLEELKEQMKVAKEVMKRDQELLGKLIKK